MKTKIIRGDYTVIEFKPTFKKFKVMYKITGKTNPWIAQHDSNFNGKTEITLHKYLTLAEAKKLMIDFYNEDYETNYPNWGLIVANGKGTACTDSDGLYKYEYDSRIYKIEKL